MSSQKRKKISGINSPENQKKSWNELFLEKLDGYNIFAEKKKKESQLYSQKQWKLQKHELRYFLGTRRYSFMFNLFREFFGKPKSGYVEINFIITTFVEKFFSSEEEEKRKIEETNIKELESSEVVFFELNNITIPREILGLIFQFLPKDRKMLETLGSVNSSWYVLLLSSWESVRIASVDHLYKISLLVMKSLKHIIISDFSKFSDQEGKYLSKQLNSSKIKSISFAQSNSLDGLSRFFRLMKNENTVFRNCEQLIFPSHLGYKKISRFEDDLISSVCPNVKSVRNPVSYGKIFKSLKRMEEVKLDEIGNYVNSKFHIDDYVENVMNLVALTYMIYEKRGNMKSFNKRLEGLISLFPNLRDLHISTNLTPNEEEKDISILKDLKNLQSLSLSFKYEDYYSIPGMFQSFMNYDCPKSFIKSIQFSPNINTLRKLCLTDPPLLLLIDIPKFRKLKHIEVTMGYVKILRRQQIDIDYFEGCKIDDQKITPNEVFGNFVDFILMQKNSGNLESADILVYDQELTGAGFLHVMISRKTEVMKFFGFHKPSSTNTGYIRFYNSMTTDVMIQKILELKLLDYFDDVPVFGSAPWLKRIDFCYWSGRSKHFWKNNIMKVLLPHGVTEMEGERYSDFVRIPNNPREKWIRYDRRMFRKK